MIKNGGKFKQILNVKYAVWTEDPFLHNKHENTVISVYELCVYQPGEGYCVCVCVGHDVLHITRDLQLLAILLGRPHCPLLVDV